MGVTSPERSIGATQTKNQTSLTLGGSIGGSGNDENLIEMLLFGGSAKQRSMMTGSLGNTMSSN
jgi:hypothetical protein